MQHLSEEDKAKIGALADAVLHVIADRYRIDFNQVRDATIWVLERRAHNDKLQFGAYLSLVGTLVAAAATVGWAGAKALIREVIK